MRKRRDKVFRSGVSNFHLPSILESDHKVSTSPIHEGKIIYKSKILHEKRGLKSFEDKSKGKVQKDDVKQNKAEENEELIADDKLEKTNFVLILTTQGLPSRLTTCSRSDIYDKTPQIRLKIIIQVCDSFPFFALYSERHPSEIGKIDQTVINGEDRKMVIENFKHLTSIFF